MKSVEEFWSEFANVLWEAWWENAPDYVKEYFNNDVNEVKKGFCADVRRQIDICREEGDEDVLVFDSQEGLEEMFGKPLSEIDKSDAREACRETYKNTPMYVTYKGERVKQFSI